MTRSIGFLSALLLLLSLAPTATAAPREIPRLPAGADVDYQLGGPTSVPERVQIVARDRTEEPAGVAFDICYVNGYQAQSSERRFWRQHMDLVLQRDGEPVVDRAWNEWLLDVRTPAKRRALARIMGRWVDGCADAGYDAVEYDNLDSYTRSQKLISRRQALAFAQLLTREAHRAGLAAGQKNLAGYDGTVIGFDYAVSEECARYDECDAYVADYGSQVVMVEYRRADFDRACEAYGETHPIVLRDRDLRPGFRGRRWC